MLKHRLSAWISRIPDGFRVDRAVSLLWQVARGWFAAGVAFMLVQALLPLTTLYVLKLLVDRLTELTAQADGGGSFDRVLGFIVAAFALSALGTLISALQGHANLVQSHRVRDFVLQQVQKKSVEMDLEFYESPRYHDKLHRAQQEAPARPMRIVQGLTQVGRSSLTLAGTLVLLVRFHWGVAVAVIAASIPTLYYRIKYAHAMYEWHREKTASERLGAYLNQVLTTAEHAKEVRTYGYGAALIERFGELRDRLRSGILRISAQRSRKQVVTEATAGLAGFGSLAFIAHAALKGTITLGDLVMYFGAFQVGLAAVRASLRGVAELYENNLFLSTLYEFLGLRKRVMEPARPRGTPPQWRTGLRVEGLSFRYPGTDRLVLDGVEMAILPGQTVALVGRNGSGKTTLAKLLCRLYDPTSGRISIDGIDIRDFELESFRRTVGVFFQDFGRYSLTARENIWLGCPSLDPHADAINQAAMEADIHEPLSRLQQGYETVLSRSLTEGEELSIGHWQKLALARVIARNASFVILDEPTSFLDAAAELEFLERFHNIVRDRSALVISHRFSTVRLADQVCVLDGGRIIERGNHDHLITADGLYAELFQKQASYYTVEDSVARTPGGLASRGE